MSELRPDLTEERLSNIPVQICFNRSIAELPNLACTDEPVFNYKPYDLFVLSSKIGPIVNKILGKPVNLHFESTRINDKMVLGICAYSGDIFIPFDERQSAKISEVVSRATSVNPKHCSLIHFNVPLTSDSGKRIPKDWILSVIRSYPIPEEYDPIIQDEMLLLNLSFPLTDLPWIDIYSDLLNNLVSWLIKGYKSAWITCSPEFALDWKLIPLDEEVINQGMGPLSTLYKPIWYDLRITDDIWLFLRDRLSGDPYVRLSLPEDINNVKIYQIVKNLIANGFRFCVYPTYILIEIYTFEECSFVASLIEEGQLIEEPLQVAEIPIATLSKLYLQILGKSADSDSTIDGPNIIRFGRIINDKAIVYPTSDLNRPLTVSIIIPYDANPFASANDIIEQHLSEEQQKNLNIKY